MTITEKQREERRQGIGGSDAAAILGLSPWKTALDVWLEKLGKVPPTEPTEAMEWGNRLEDVLADEYARRTGRKVRRVNQAIAHPGFPWMRANLDRRVLSNGGGPKRILEIKTAGRWADWDAWGDDGTDQVPDHYLCQVIHYLAVTGADLADVAVLFGGQEFRIYTVPRDQELVQTLIEQEKAFWNDNVLAQIPPTPETVAAAAKLWPTCRGGAVEATDEIIEHIRRFEAAKAEIKIATEDKKEAELELWKALGEAENLVYNGQTIATLKQQTRKAHEVKESTFRSLRITKHGKEVL